MSKLCWAGKSHSILTSCPLHLRKKTIVEHSVSLRDVQKLLEFIQNVINQILDERRVGACDHLTSCVRVLMLPSVASS